MKKGLLVRHPAWPMCTPPTAFVDVDGTLLLWTGKNGAEAAPPINEALILRIRALKADGWDICVWSYGSAEHARRAVEYCGIADVVDWCINKPTLIVDDTGPRFAHAAAVELPERAT